MKVPGDGSFWALLSARGGRNRQNVGWVRQHGLLAMTDLLRAFRSTGFCRWLAWRRSCLPVFACLGKTSVDRALVAWLATIFMVYRMCLWWLGWQRPCGCLGSLARVLHLSEHTADNLMQGVLAYLLLGSYGWLLWQWRQGRGGPGEDGG